MNVKELYDNLGGDFTGVMKRLQSEKLIDKFLSMFLKDQTYEQLKNYLDASQKEEAFMQAHTLKGVCANLGFSKLYDIASALTESIRSKESVIDENTFKLINELEKEYERTILLIQEYINSK